MNHSLDFLIGKIVLADMGGYSLSGKLISARGSELTIKTRSGSRILINRGETRAIKEITSGKKRCKA